MTRHESIQPNNNGFDSDPLGYGALAWHKWAMAQTLAGFDIDMEKVHVGRNKRSALRRMKALHSAHYGWRLMRPTRSPRPTVR